MLLSATRFDASPVELFLHVALAPEVSIAVVYRRGLFYDGATAPACDAPSRGRVAVQVLLSGTLAASNGVGRSGPALFAIPEENLEGANGRRAHTVQTAGDPHELVSINIDADLLAFPTPTEPTELRLDAAVEHAARSYLRAAVEGNASPGATLLDELSRAGLLREVPLRRPPRSVEQMERIWNGLSSFFAAMDTAPTRVMLMELAELSPRHADRMIRQFTSTYGLPDEGFRDLTRRWRLKLATLLLSSPSLSVQTVARRVGYRGSEALANAMAQAGLPAPSKYRVVRPREGQIS